MAFSDIISILKLDEKAMRAVAKDTDATRDAHIIIAVSALLASAFSFMFEISRGTVILSEYGASVGEQTAMLILAAIIGAGLSIGFTWCLALLYRLFARMLGGKGSIVGIFRVIGHAGVLMVFLWVPLISFAVFIFSIVLNVKAISSIERLSTGKAIGSLALAVAVVFAAFVLLALSVNLALYASGYAPQLQYL